MVSEILGMCVGLMSICGAVLHGGTVWIRGIVVGAVGGSWKGDHDSSSVVALFDRWLFSLAGRWVSWPVWRFQARREGGVQTIPVDRTSHN